jgi:hypothetical protein
LDAVRTTGTPTLFCPKKRCFRYLDHLPGPRASHPGRPRALGDVFGCRGLKWQVEVGASSGLTRNALILQESDITCKRNAFVALCNVSHASAVQYLLNASESIDSMDELMQMAVIDLIRADAKLESPNRVSWGCLWDHRGALLTKFSTCRPDGFEPCSAC